jgi:transcriptional regulator with XRE-family HTH domain
MSKTQRNTPSRALLALSGNLKAIALEKRWDTQEEVGKAIGLPQKSVSRIFNALHEPQLDTLCQIADKLNLRESVLLLPNLGAGNELSDKRISEHLRPLIEQLVRLDNEGRLTDHILTFIKMGIDMATHTVPQQDRPAKGSAQ